VAEFANLKRQGKLHELGDSVSFYISGDKTAGYEVLARFWRYYPNLHWTLFAKGKNPEQLVDGLVKQYRVSNAKMET
jgi:hypothetical protein